MITAISIVSVLLTLFYCALMGNYRRGFRQIPAPGASMEANAFITVIIPARNEEENIVRVLTALQKQSYPHDKFEIMVADDHSTDNTVRMALSLGINNLRVIELGKIPGRQYKKAAITEAVQQARGEIIITTDADCTMEQEWISRVASFFTTHSAALVSGPVVFNWNTKAYSGQQNFFLRIQQLEFAGLVGIGGAALQLKFPNMCNGANLAYRKEIFNEVGGYMGNDNLLSGDDEFLMHKIYHRYPQQVFFLKDSRVVVQTPPAYTVGQFFAQRMRWVSKSTRYSDKRITLVLAMAYLFNLTILANLVCSIFYPALLYIFAGQLFFKVITEYMFYNDILKFFGLKKLAKLIAPAQPFHIAYVLAIGILGNMGSYNWKGRKQ